VIAGDWLLAASLEYALRAQTPGAVEALVRTLRLLVEGEARQIALRGKTDFTSEDALQIAHLKTGSLFAFCGEAGALVARAPREVVAALRDFGLRAGSAFQIADDLLDFESDAATLGKAVLADVREGKPSLPLAIALKRLPPLREEMAALLQLAPETPEDEVRSRVRAFAARLARTGALGAARRIAEKERDAALAALEPVPQSPTRELLALVARALLSRNH
jgi:octaprenyl-diphosphate synthase